VIFMHPVGGGAYLPMVTGLARAGCHVIYCNSRYRGVDSALIMEKVVLDLAACVRDARERLGYERVILGGWSGGGSLSLFYQEQAEHPTVRSTPAGDPPDLTTAGLVPADGILLLAAHVSRHGTLTEWLDAAVADEANPRMGRDRELDLYDQGNPNRPPYSREFVERYRAAQVARNRRISAWVKIRLAELKAAGAPYDELAFVVHGTMADPRWLDPCLEPSDRRPGWCYLGDPRVVNNGPVGLARFSTLRSWLSQWSYDDARADGPRCATEISAPTLVITNTADDACTPSHAERLYAAIRHGDKEIHRIEGATHYYIGPDQKPRLAQAVEHCRAWLARHGWSD
jgi:alpha-beta hydrolase superfamily lysophospholipase